MWYRLGGTRPEPHGHICMLGMTEWDALFFRRARSTMLPRAKMLQKFLKSVIQILFSSHPHVHNIFHYFSIILEASSGNNEVLLVSKKKT